MTTERTCDLCAKRLTNEETAYDLDGRYEFRLVRAKHLTWWRWGKRTRDLDVCGNCVRTLAEASVSGNGEDS